MGFINLVTGQVRLITDALGSARDEQKGTLKDDEGKKKGTKITTHQNL